MSIVLASRNKKKAREMAALLHAAHIDLCSLADFPAAPEVIESGSTFAENAALKASQTARALQRWTLADDCGLMVDALDGAPGVLSARYAGPDATDDENNDKLLQALSNVPDPRRTARFVCHLAVADPSGEVRLNASGHCRGVIVRQVRGRQGFGYDPLFLIPEYSKTFGELSPVVKSCLSHRSRAFRQLAPLLARLNCEPR
jgi:XTP/dITP diphosphohydrolase